jgi:TRAP-type mannitol/chloroaromatic compound transport system substrate-binding protein
VTIENAPSRRRFLTGTAGVVAAAATVAMPNVSRAQTAVLKMQSSWGATSPFQDMARQYIERVEAMAGGRLKIDLLASGAVVKAFQVQEACHRGVLDAAHSVTALWYIKNSAAALFGLGPVFGANASQILAWIHYGGGKELYRELVQDVLRLDLVGFFAMPMPAQPLGWFKFPVENADQMRSLKYRTVGLATEVMRGMGVKVTQLPGGEIKPALERGEIDAFDFNNPTSDSRFGAQNVAKHYHLSSYHQAAEFFEITFNKTRFERLPKEHRAILEYSAEAASTANYGRAMDIYSAALQTLIDEHGVTVYRTAESILKAQLASWDTLIERLSEDDFFKKVVESQKSWSERVAFYDLVNAADHKLAYEHFFPGKLPF